MTRSQVPEPNTLPLLLPSKIRSSYSAVTLPPRSASMTPGSLQSMDSPGSAQNAKLPVLPRTKTHLMGPQPLVPTLLPLSSTEKFISLAAMVESTIRELLLTISIASILRPSNGPRLSPQTTLLRVVVVILCSQLAKCSTYMEAGTLSPSSPTLSDTTSKLTSGTTPISTTTCPDGTTAVLWSRLSPHGSTSSLEVKLESSPKEAPETSELSPIPPASSTSIH